MFRRTLSCFACLALVTLCTDNLAAHEGGHDSHPNDAEKFFTTRPSSRVLPLAKEEDVFHFVVYGDRTGGVPAGLKVLEQAVVDTNLLDPDLVMTVGDLVQGYNETPEWMQQMAEYQEIMNRLKMQWFPVPGNHDVYWRGEGKSPEGQHESNFEKHFGPLWYTFQHKNAGFVVLYSDEGDRATNEKGFNEGRLQTMSVEQLEFLEQALEKHKDLDHVFLFLHHPRWVGAGYTGGNWDVVHEMLREAGNVTAVFAGHIHHMRFDGPKDGIAYYTLATTGAHLSADIPKAGYLHHLNVVTVRPETATVASLPIGSVIDPTEFTAEFLAEVDRARRIRPREVQNDLLLAVDGSASGRVVFALENSSSRDIDVTASFDPSARDWITSLDHDHFTLAPGKKTQLEVRFHREADLAAELTVPRLMLDMQYLGKSARIGLPSVSTPVSLKLAAVPADYFDTVANRCLQVIDEQSVLRIDSSELRLHDGPFTLEAWVNPAQTAGHRGLIAKTEGSEFAFFMDEGVPQFDVHLDGHYVNAKARDVLKPNQWSHLAGVFDGSELRLFVNGKRVGSAPGSGKRTRNDLPLYVGADPDHAGRPHRPFVGKIDEVRISKKAMYQEDFSPLRRFAPEAETLMLLHLDRRLGPFVLDHSRSAIKGTLGPKAELVAVP
ncbi:LamG-like jellyroll fold domain-containing protein [Novipirellula artificiosorum]|uniref:Cyclic 3',5'-adenosine monophosphate phosphodiesterase n=1 Tax=Novipirellula artificiosorum TaxID=2528016 RepID=A0A5C6DZ19_9BACT|nr:LamG-like jellyroll fold domain-containing protein [Novipirellula artificiosorum]TWU41077.1 cyclic 3',5'-adenosine monophosphate phosphodiesterase [Novipirellula artificiosorum]